jgi:hypothetical protein
MAWSAAGEQAAGEPAASNDEGTSGQQNKS